MQMNALSLSARRRRSQVVTRFISKASATLNRAVPGITAVATAAGYVGFLADSAALIGAAAAVAATAIFIVEPLTEKGGVK